MRSFTPKSLAAWSSPTDLIKAGRSMTCDYPPSVEKRKGVGRIEIHPSWTNEGNQQLTIPSMDYRAEIGRRIREARLAKGWTLDELSAAVDGVLSKTRINGYENGDKLPGPETIALLAKALGRRSAYMTAFEDKMEEALLRNWWTLSERDRMTFFRQLETASMQSRDPVPDSRTSHLVTKVRARPEK